MKLLLIGAALLSLALAKEYNFNSVDNCKQNKIVKKTLDSDDRAIVKFKEPGGGIGAKANKLFGTIPDRCSMRFEPTILSLRDRLSVRFDADRRKINDPSATITFYDASEVKSGKKVLEVSKDKPITANSSFTTKGRYLVIEVERDFDNAKDYNVEMIIEPVSSASTTKWSLAAATMALVLAYII